jgi:hypothetical protein
LRLFIDTLVSPNLCFPELFSRPRPLEQVAVVTMPEATVDENDRTVSWKNQIGLAGKPLVVEFVSEASGVKAASYCQLRLGVNRLDRSHVTAASNGIMYVRHQTAKAS